MIQRLGASSMSFKGQTMLSPRDTFNAVMEENKKIQEYQNSLQESTPNAAQGEKLNTVA